MKKLLLLAVVILFAPALFAQDTNSSLQLSVDYSYLRFAQNTYIPNFSLNGEASPSPTSSTSTSA